MSNRRFYFMWTVLFMVVGVWQVIERHWFLVLYNLSFASWNGWLYFHRR